MGHPVGKLAAPRIKAVCPVCGRDLECEVAFKNPDKHNQYTIVVGPLGHDHIASHY